MLVVYLILLFFPFPSFACTLDADMSSIRKQPLRVPGMADAFAEINPAIEGPLWKDVTLRRPIFSSLSRRLTVTSESFKVR